MNFHSFIEYLKYLWRAKGRHGTHSPFVYDFVERVLMDDGVIDKQYRVVVPALALRYENIISRIAAHYAYRSIVQLPGGTVANGSVDMAVIDGAKPAAWSEIMSRLFAQLHNNSAVVVADIHKSAAHTAAWDKLRADDRVRMNIDLYGIGVLFFKQEFKVRQGFVLKG